MLVELLNSCSTLNFGASLCGWTFPCVRLALSNAFGAKLWILLLPVNEVMGVGGRGRVVNGGESAPSGSRRCGVPSSPCGWSNFFSFYQMGGAKTS